MKVTIPVALDAAPLPAPQGWRHVLLDDVAKRGSGHTPSKSHPDYWNGQIQWISLADSDRLDRVFIESTAAKITEKGLPNSSAVLHPAGTVVLSRDAGVGKSAVMRHDMAVSQHFMAWQCGPALNNVFLYYLLQNRKREFERIAAGSTIKTIGLPYFKELTVLCPPRPEQDRIAAALLDADALIDSLEQLLTKKRKIKEGAMQELLTGKRRLPGLSRPWATRKLGEITTITMGRTPARLAESFWGIGHKWLSIADLKGKVIADSKEEITDAGAEGMEQVPEGTLLMSFKLTIGRLSFAGCMLYTNEAICALRSPQVDKELLYYALSRVDFSLFGKQAVKGYTLNKESLRNVEVLLPADPMEQRAIAQVLADLDTEIESLESRLIKARALKQAMAQALLTGRIRLVPEGAGA